MTRKKYMGRRQFLKTSTMAASVSLGALVLGVEIFRPQTAFGAEKNFHQSSCGKENKSSFRVLVAYESHTGTTGDIAKTIGDTLCEMGATVDVRMVSNVTNLTPYHAAVIGSAVHKQRWMTGAMDFVGQHKQQLQKMPVAYFLACLAMTMGTAEGARKEAASYMAPILAAVPEVKPVAQNYFAGVLDYEKLSMLESMIMKSKMKKLGVAEGDYRNWNAIRNWSKTLYPNFIKARPVAA